MSYEFNNLSDIHAKLITINNNLCRSTIDSKHFDHLNELDAKIGLFLKENFSKRSVSRSDNELLQNIEIEIGYLKSQVRGIGLSDRLDNLAKKVAKTYTNQTFTTEFSHHANWRERAQFMLERFFNFFVGRTRDAINREFYFEWKSKNLIAETMDNLEKLEEQLEGLNTKKANLTYPADSKEMVALDKSIDRLTKKIDAANRIIHQHTTHLEEARQTRQQFTLIGGERVELQTKDQTKLDGLYLSADEFRQRCREAKGSLFTIDEKIESPFAGLTGLSFDLSDENSSQETLLNALNELKLCPNPAKEAGGKGAGWVSIKIEGQDGQKGQILIVTEEEAQKLAKKGVIQQTQNQFPNYTTHSFNPSAIKRQEIIQPETAGGTVILTTGSSSIYEMHKREALAYLLQGMNVMMFNFRGYGLSEGKPTTEGSYQDIEAAYEYVKRVHPTEDKKILVKTFCLSGGIGAKLAQKHPELNLILDQTYSEMRNIAVNTIMEEARKILNYPKGAKHQIKEAIYQYLQTIIRAAIRPFIPSYNIKDKINDLKGNIFILRASQDTFTDKTETDRIIDELLKRSPKQLQKIKIASMPGNHGTSWLDPLQIEDSDQLSLNTPHYVGRVHMQQFIHAADLARPIVPKPAIEKFKTLLKEMESNPAPIHITFTDAEIDELTKMNPAQDLEIETTASELTKTPLSENQKSFMARIDEAIDQLDAIKTQLGASTGVQRPRLQTGKRFLGVVPYEFAQIYIQNGVKGNRVGIFDPKWLPKRFWEHLAKQFEMEKDDLGKAIVKREGSKYEYVSLTLQSLRQMAEKQKKIEKKFHDGDRDAGKFFQMTTSLYLHDEQNSPEQIIFDMHNWLTQFEQEYTLAKQEGRLKYFFNNAFNDANVCFEARVRAFDEYTTKEEKLRESAALLNTSSVQNVSRQPVIIDNLNDYTLKHLQDFQTKLEREGGNAFPSYTPFKEYLVQKGILDAFVVEEGKTIQVDEARLTQALEYLRDDLVVLQED